MTTVTIRKKLHQFIDSIAEEKAKAFYTLFEAEINQSEGISIEQYNNEIDEAEEEFKKGEFITHNEMLSKVKKW